MADTNENDPELRAYLIGITQALGGTTSSWTITEPHNNRTLAAFALGLHHMRPGSVPLSRGDLKAAIESIVSGAESPPPYTPPLT